MAVTVDVGALLLLDLVVIVVVARLLGALARRLGQPAVVGEILGGILLGPTLFGGAITRSLFPAEVRPSLGALATVGVCVFMFLIGLHVDSAQLRGQGRVATTVSLSAVVVPFALGAVLALYLLQNHPTGNRLAFVLFLGLAMSVTAFPVLARILADRGLIHTPIGGLALAAAAVDDVLAWTLLAVVAAMVTDGGGADVWRVLLAVPFVVFMVLVVRPLLRRLADRHAELGPFASAAVAVVVTLGLLLSARATDWMGLHAIFGAFLFGVAMPRTGARALRERALPWVERIGSVVLLPIFFMVAGLDVDLSHIDGTALGELGLILLVAIGGKVAGTFIGARVSGVHRRHATILAVLINTRGLTGLIVLTVGLQLGVIDHDVFSLMVVMALVTTAMTGVLLRLVYPPDQVRRDLAELAAERAAERKQAP